MDVEKLMREHERVTVVLFFLLGAREDDQMYNSHRATEAFDAACALFGVDPAEFVLKSKGFIK